MTKKIHFGTLYRKFKPKIIIHFFLTIFWTVWSIILFGAVIELFKKGKVPSDYNYAKILIPKKIREWGLLNGINISQRRFIIIGLLLVAGYTLLCYWNHLWEEELRIKGRNYTENLILDKFRRLRFEEKQIQKDKVNKLVETDSWEIGNYWEHLPNHVFHNVLKIIGLLFFYSSQISEMSGRAMAFSLFWLGLISIFVYFFTRRVLQNEKKYKERLDKEWAIVNKERTHITLIESMGLTSEYRERQRKIKQANEKLGLKFNRTKSWSKTIPKNLLLESFPFLLLFLSGSSFDGGVMIVFWWVFDEFASIFQCLWDYADYNSSRSRINNFLALPEKDDNLTGIKLSPAIPLKEIRFEKVYFRYQGQKEWTVRNYSRIFSTGKINQLQGKNGTGKSTILYLLLGVLKPQQGKIILESENGQTYELPQEINLAHWRTNNVAYCSHETLVEEGSTGQKQLANINQALEANNSAQIWLFDETDNALDKERQVEFKSRIGELVKNNKITIYVGHKDT